MSYRHFNYPTSTGWTVDDWTSWAQDEQLLLDVSPDIPEPICAVCWGGTGTFERLEIFDAGDPFGSVRKVTSRYSLCVQCNRNRGLLHGVLPISYSVHDRLESAIWRAKNDPQYRWLNTPLACILNGFLDRHFDRIERRWGSVDVITTIPSHHTARTGWDHMKHLLGRVESWPAQDRWVQQLLVKTSVSTAAERRHGDPVAGLFVLGPESLPVRGQRVLLIDDTFTTGGTIRSAAKAIIEAGGLPPLVVTIGRQVKANDFGQYIIEDRLAREPLFDIDHCAINP